MKIEDVKIGCKVKLVSIDSTEEHLGYDQYEMLHVGSVSEVTDFGTDIDECDNVELSDGYWYAVEDLELYEESKSTALSEIKVKLSLEDKEEVAKDILKIALQDLNVIISNAIEDLSDEKKEDDTKPELDFSNEKLQTLFDEAIKEVIKEQVQDAVSSLNKAAFNI